MQNNICLPTLVGDILNVCITCGAFWRGPCVWSERACQVHALVGRLVYYSLPSFYRNRLHLFTLVVVMYCLAFGWTQRQALVFERFLSQKADFETIYSIPTTVCHQQVPKKRLELKKQMEARTSVPLEANFEYLSVSIRWLSSAWSMLPPAYSIDRAISPLLFVNQTTWS